MIDIENMKLVSETDPVLMQECSEFKFEEPVFDAELFSKKLHDVMVKHDGLGLSANQVGIPVRAFAMRVDAGAPFVLFNPKIVSVSDNIISMKEGCLSFPLLYMSVKRPDAVRIRFRTFEGEIKTQQFIGMSARVALHEMDHMDGITFTHSKVTSSFEMQRAVRKRMILKRKVK